MLTHLKAIFKFCSMIFVIVVMLIHHTLIYLFLRGKKRTHYIVRSTQIHCAIGLRILGVKVTHVPKLTGVHGKFIVANHMSYVDILIMFSHHPGLFITSVEIKETPFLGQITSLTGCFFVERRKAKRSAEVLQNEMKSMQEELALGHNVILFPEGTSTDGTVILPFKTTLFQVAIDQKATLAPMAIKYTHVNEAPFTRENADLVCWYGDMEFAGHLYKLCLQDSVSAELRHLPEMPAAPHSRAELGSILHSQIQEAYFAP